MKSIPIGNPPTAAGAASTRPYARPWAVASSALCAVASVAVSLARLVGRPLSIEDGSGWAIATLPIADILACIRRDANPPLYYLLLKGWCALGGDSAMWLRLFSALQLLAAAAGLAALARRLWPGDRAASRVLPLAWLVLPYTLWYGTYVKMYALEAALFVWSFVAALRAFETGRARDELAAGIIQLAGLYTHYWLALPTLVLGSFEVLRRRPVRGVVLRYAGILVLYLPWLGVASQQYRGVTDGYPPTLIPAGVLLMLPSQVILLSETWPEPSLWSLGIALVAVAAVGGWIGRGERRLPVLLLVLPVLLAFVASSVSGISLVHPAQLFPVVTMLPPAVWPVARRVPEVLAIAWTFPAWRLGALVLGGLPSLPGLVGVAERLKDREPGSWVIIASPYLYGAGRWALRGQPDVYAIDRPADRRIPGLSALPWMPRKTLDQVAAAGGVPAIYVVGHVQRPTIEPTPPQGWSLRSTRTYNECMSLGSPVAGEIRVREYGRAGLPQASVNARAGAAAPGRSGGGWVACEGTTGLRSLP